MTDFKFIIIDLFCGAGGTTTGFDMATANGDKIAKVVACVNHDPVAIKSHWKNHPEVEHFEEDITTLYGHYQRGMLFTTSHFNRLIRLVGLYRTFYPDAKVILWASLECTNFSKAKGGKPREADSRTLAHHLHPYIIGLNPDYVKIENVVEFMAWGPLDAKGKPISRKNGQDWLKWRESINTLGYRDEWREMNAADYGALTSRNRLFGCFAKPGLPIVWPEPTHAKNPEKTSLYKPLQKWQAVKQVLDFNDEGNSVFNRKKPLSSKTMQRLFMGCVKHIAGGQKNFISKYYSGKPEDKSSSVNDPAPTLTTIPHESLVQANFITRGFSSRVGMNGSSVENPFPTVTTQIRERLAFIQKYNGNRDKTGGNNGKSVDEPAPVIACQPRMAVAFISRYNGVNGGKHDNSHSVESPIGALGTGDNHAKVTAQFLNLYYSGGGQDGSIESPAGTIPTKDRIAKVQAEFFIDKQFSGNANHQSIDQPAGAILGNDKHSLIKADKWLMNTNFSNVGSSLENPSPVITADRHAHYIINPSWGGNSGSIEEPCHVVIARQDKAPLYLITLHELSTENVWVPVYEGDCEWTIKLKEFMALYNIADIKMRMLKVIELKLIQGFPADYILLGNQSDQKKCIGNAVVPIIPCRWTEAYEPYFPQLKQAA